MYFACHLHLGASLEEPQPDDTALAVVQAAHSVPQSNTGQPVVVRVFGVTNLIHHADRVRAVVEHRLEQRHRVEYRVEREHDLLFRHVHQLGQFHDVRLTLVLADERLLSLQSAVRRVAQAARDSHGTVVAQVAADFADDHRYGVGGEAHAEFGIKIVDGFHQADAPDLKQVVRRFAATLKPLNNAEHQPQIAANQLIACLLVSGSGFFQKLVRLFSGEHRQSRCIHTADLNFCLHKIPSCWSSL